jgi:hypothetical protein
MPTRSCCAVTLAVTVVSIHPCNANAQPAAEPEVAPAAPAEEAVRAEEVEPPGQAAPAPAPAPALNAGYEKGFFIADADHTNKMKISARVQTRYTFEALDGATDESAFSIPRARLTLSGNTLTKRLAYKFQMDLGKGSVALKDFYVDLEVKKWLRLRAGQWKRPFSRQQITSSGRQELVDRAITDKAFGAGRDIGIAVHNNIEKSPGVEYAVGLFNGTGDKASFSGDVLINPMLGEGEVTSGKFSNVPVRFHPALVARVGYNHGKIKGYSEADLEGGPLRFSVAASGIADFDADGGDDGELRAEVDAITKVSGFSASGAAYLATEQDGDGFADQATAAIGGHVQVGYMVTSWLQPVARYALVAPDGPSNNTQEVGGGLSLYLFGHKLKWQTDVLALTEQQVGTDPTNWLVRSQLQLSI